jgi:hypothetical protein
LYSFSAKTWTIRKSLLNVLKGYLMRSESGYTEAIRAVIQHQVIEQCLTSDNYLAKQVDAINASLFPPPDYEWIVDEALLAKDARYCFLASVPDALRLLMGTQATTQSLDILFTALQERTFAKALVSAVLCDVARALVSI